MKTRQQYGQVRVVGVAMGLALASLAVSGVAIGDVPPAHVAEPGVYKVVAENDEFRVLMATWQPGQKDAQHSHPSNVAYRLTDCKNKIVKADGTVARTGEVKAGSVILQKPVASHSFQNISDKVCQTLIVEKKK